MAARAVSVDSTPALPYVMVRSTCMANEKAMMQYIHMPYLACGVDSR